ncbi:MAG: hypothetical protein KIT11_07465 [Fimbriimonadaceae bacterium]|nr:hypothetical protein [Fimbriimonadaceae bacterium]QYK56190.1 MAG: hypothetical protein KF733_01655 [Fimbriimonadaceae bacterium]
MSIAEGSRVRVKDRPMNAEDAKAGLYPHMCGLTGVVENYYNDEEIAVKVDFASMPDVYRDVHTEATDRMRKKFRENESEVRKSALTKDELDFVPNFVVLVRKSDIEAI